MIKSNNIISRDMLDMLRACKGRKVEALLLTDQDFETSFEVVILRFKEYDLEIWSLEQPDKEGGVSDLAKIIESNGTSALAHLTCVRSTSEQLKEAIRSFKDKGIENILALRGDLPKDAAEDENLFPSGLYHADGLVRILKDEGFCVGGACYPESHPESLNRNVDIENLKHKVDAGVDFLTTQMFFDNEMLYSFLYRLQAAGIHVPVLAGIMPITNANQVARMIDLSNACIPRKLLAICDKFRSSPEAMRQAGIAYATDQIIDLISNGVRGIHIYTMNKPEIASEIIANVDSIIKATNQL